MEKELAYKLYELYRNEIGEHFKSHRESLQNYLAFASAILGVTIIGILQIQGKGLIGLIIIVVPILNLFICFLAIRMCDRFYLGALERIALTAKLESALGLYEPMSIPAANKNKRIEFPKDKQFLPERWLIGANYGTIEEFVTHNLKIGGVNRVAKSTFYLLIMVNILLSIASIIVPFI